MRSGGCPAGSGRALRLDPFALPVRYAAGDAAADGRVREIELHRERVVVRRSLAGMRMALNMPVDGLHRRRPAADRRAKLPSCWRTRIPAWRCRCFCPIEADDVTADWRSWGAVLGLPLLVEDEDGWREPFERLGGVAHRASASAPPPPQRLEAPPALDPAAPRAAAASPRQRRCIAASARLSPEIDPQGHPREGGDPALLAALQLQRAALHLHLDVVVDRPGAACSWCAPPLIWPLLNSSTTRYCDGPAAVTERLR